MFTRTHRIGRHLYTEALESYRDPDTGRPRHRCVARWRAERSLAEEIGRTQHAIDRATNSATYYRGVIDRTVKPRFPKHRKDAPECAAAWQRRLDTAMTHLAALTAARQAGVPAADADIERAAQAEAARWAALTGRAHAILQPRRAPADLTAIAERVRRLATQNDPDALRAEATAIAAALDALTPRATPL
jgi:hypothetical protein